MSSNEEKINEMLDRVRQQGNPRSMNSHRRDISNRPILTLGQNNRPNNLNFTPKQNENAETERRLKEIMKISGKIKIEGTEYMTDVKEMQDIEELGNGTCGHVVKMRHLPSGKIIAVKQMRRSGNKEETKRIIMDIEVVLKSHDCKYIVQCLGCFITDSEVWICMELMDTCFDKLLKKLKQAVPEEVIGKITVAVVEALSYLKDTHGVIHRDVKPSNILLDMKGNVKLCDFGISGRLVDSMAKTRSAGCAGYMAPERIEPDPNNPDYDVRADVWSLGITLVELATGDFPYKDCKTDFEVLSKVIREDPPFLPDDKDFSPDFRDFVKCCLEKKKELRPKYVLLKDHPFMKKSLASQVNVGEWYARASQRANADATGNGAAPRPNLTSNPIRQFFSSHHKQQPKQPPPLPHTQQSKVVSPPPTQQHKINSPPHLSNGTTTLKTEESRPPVAGHNSRLSLFQQQRAASDYNQPTQKTFSPYQAYQNHVAAQLRDRHESHIPIPQRIVNSDKSFVTANNIPVTESNKFQSPILGRRPLYSSGDSQTNSPYLQRRGFSETRCRSPSASPVLPLRSAHNVDSNPQYNPGNTSPIILQRFYHQQKQQQMAKEAEESGKKRFASYIKLQLSGDRSGRSSRHQSPEPPPRLNRNISGDSQSPLALRRNLLEAHTPNSPSLPRRYVSPTPPVPPPRRLSESNSVPGSPQHLRARFHYTPEPQRRLFQNNDVS